MLGELATAVDAEHLNYFHPDSLGAAARRRTASRWSRPNARPPRRGAGPQEGPEPASRPSSGQPVPAARADRRLGAARRAVPGLPRRERAVVEHVARCAPSRLGFRRTHVEMPVGAAAERLRRREHENASPPGITRRFRWRTARSTLTKRPNSRRTSSREETFESGLPGRRYCRPGRVRGRAGSRGRGDGAARGARAAAFRTGST